VSDPSTNAVVDAVMRLTGDMLPVGESLLVTRLPNGELYTVRLRLTSSVVPESTNHVFDSNPPDYERREAVRFEGYVVE